MGAETLTKNGQAETQSLSTPAKSDELLRALVRRRLERVRRLKLHIAAFVTGMIVLTPLWALVESQDNGGFERFSNDGRPGDWEPWILYVALIWGAVVAFKGLKVYFDRPTTEEEIDSEIERLTSHR